jgi:hypothetical protein
MESDMTDDDPITLDDACAMFGGKIRKATLRAEADRGNLTIFRIGRRDFTTRSLVQEMIHKCRVRSHRPGSPSTENAEHGRSETDRITSAQAALNRMLQEQKRRSKPTSPPSTGRDAAHRH